MLFDGGQINMLRKVISGGQTGVDIAALRAAKACGLETGGWVPKGCRTLDGPNYDLVKVYGCVEDSSSQYPPRTRRNVSDSDGTLRLARNFSSPGELCTLKALHDLHKPFCDVQVNKDMLYETLPSDIVSWLLDSKIEVLNVAGNSEKTCRGIELVAREFLISLFSCHRLLTDR